MDWRSTRGAMLGVLYLAVSGAGTAAQEAVGREASPGRAACAELARSLKDLEARGMRDMLVRDPGAVERSLGAGAVGQVRDYIALREMVLFRCPPFVLNATAAPLSERLAKAPPLPGKGPKLIRQPVAPSRALVPLPVRRPI